MAARLLRERRPGPRRDGGRRAFAPGRALRPGGGPGSPFRGRARRRLLPVHPRADPLLRRLLRMGALGPPGPAARRVVRLAHRRLAPPRPRPAGALPAALRPRTPPAPGPRRGAGLDRRRPRPRRPRRLLRQVQRGRGRPILLRALPGGIRPRPTQTARRLVHPRRGRQIHGRPRRPGADGRSRHRRRAGRR